MVNIGIKSTGKIRTAAPKASVKPAGNNSSSGIKKAISTSKPSETTENSEIKEEDSLEQSQLEESIDSSAREETAVEKKKNLDKLLKRGLTKKETPEAKDKKAGDKDASKKTNEEWENNSNAKETDPKEKEGKRTDILTDNDRLTDVLKHDKDTIAKRYPGIERPGASKESPQQAPKPQADSNNGSSQGSGGSGNGNGLGGSGNGSDSNNGSPQISKLSNGSNGSSGNHIHNNGGSFNNGGNNLNKPGIHNGGSIDISKNNHGGGSVQEPNHGGSQENQGVAHSKFESLFTEGHLEGKTIEAKSSGDAQRIASTLRDVGAFSNIELSGNSINISGFNAGKSHDVHEAHGKILGREFLDGNIDKLSFEGVNEDIASSLTEMLESKANEIGSENHSIASNCNEGSCDVSVENQQNQAEAPEIQNNIENNEEQYA